MRPMAIHDWRRTILGIMAVVMITAGTAKETAFKSLTQLDREADERELDRFGNVM